MVSATSLAEVEAALWGLVVDLRGLGHEDSVLGKRVLAAWGEANALLAGEPEAPLAVSDDEEPVVEAEAEEPTEPEEGLVDDEEPDGEPDEEVEEEPELPEREPTPFELAELELERAGPLTRNERSTGGRREREAAPDAAAVAAAYTDDEEEKIVPIGEPRDEDDDPGFGGMADPSAIFG